MATKFKVKQRSFQITSTSTDGFCTVKDLDKNTYEYNVDFERVRKFVVKENKKKVKKLVSTKKSIIFVP
tara:strand:- start:1263 stop:1469 length:207 start_codon:yes stop_codon:yes gene_type:complete